MADDNDRRYDERREAAGQHDRVGRVDHAYWNEQVELDHRYAGYRITPRRPEGFWVTKDGINVMPGATWYRTPRDAQAGIDILEAVGGDGRRFWHLLRALEWAKGRVSGHFGTSGRG